MQKDLFMPCLLCTAAQATAEALGTTASINEPTGTRQDWPHGKTFGMTNNSHRTGDLLTSQSRDVCPKCTVVRLETTTRPVIDS